MHITNSRIAWPGRDRLLAAEAPPWLWRARAGLLRRSPPTQRAKKSAPVLQHRSGGNASENTASSFPFILGDFPGFVKPFFCSPALERRQAVAFLREAAGRLEAEGCPQAAFEARRLAGLIQVGAHWKGAD